MKLQVFFDSIPHGPVRRLTKDEKDFAQGVLKLGANKRLLQNEMKKKFNKTPTMKDFTNLKSKIHEKGNDLKKAIEMLQNEYSEYINEYR